MGRLAVRNGKNLGSSFKEDGRMTVQSACFVLVKYFPQNCILSAQK